MNKGKESKAKVFFELGIAFARFSAKPDEDEYKIIREVASRLELEVPDYNELLLKRVTDGIVGPPTKWFEEPEGESLRNYSRIGTLSFAIFLLAQGNKDINDGAVQELRDLFRVEAIPAEVLDNYLIGLDASAEGAFRGLLPNFSKALSDKAAESNEEIFSNIDPAPSVFEGDVLKALLLTISEASVCYEHECYLATIILCGRIIETLIANAYQAVFRDDPRETEMGFSKMRAGLKNNGLPLEETVDAELDVIYKHRSKIVHGNISIPTKDQATGVAILTQNVINLTFRHFNDLTEAATPQTGTNPEVVVPPQGGRSNGRLKADWPCSESHSKDYKKDYKFIISNEVQDDIYVRRDFFRSPADIGSLPKGQPLTFNIVKTKKGLQAHDVQLAEDEE